MKGLLSQVSVCSPWIRWGSRACALPFSFSRAFRLILNENSFQRSPLRATSEEAKNCKQQGDSTVKTRDEIDYFPPKIESFDRRERWKGGGGCPTQDHHRYSSPKQNCTQFTQYPPQPSDSPRVEPKSEPAGHRVLPGSIPETAHTHTHPRPDSQERVVLQGERAFL